MAKRNLLVPVLTAGAVSSVVAYLVKRRAEVAVRSAQSASPMPALRHEPVARVSEAPDPLKLDLEDVFRGDEADDLELGTAAPTVRASDRVPAPSNADDAEPPAPEDLGRAWLSQATESEHSLIPSELPDVERLSAELGAGRP